MLKDQRESPDVSAAVGGECEVRFLEFTIRTASQEGATCDVTAWAGPVKTGRKTRQGSLGRGTLIIRDWPGSMMGNKLSVVSHQRTQRHKTSRGSGSHTRVLASLTSWLQKRAWHEWLYTGKWTLMNGRGNAPLQKKKKNAEDIIIWSLVTLLQIGRRSNRKSWHNLISC